MSSVKQTRDNGRIGTGKPGPGRPAGSSNKFTIHAKEAFQAAFDELGGVAKLVKWARADDANLGDFYKMYARLIPVEMTGAGGKDLIPATDAFEIAREMAFMLELGTRQQTEAVH